MEKEFDIALSFAGEDREYVEEVATILKHTGIDVFYDNFFEVDLWGKDLYQYLNDLYKNKSIFTVLFISEKYKEKLWTRHELKSAQARAFRENYEYILPVRFDDTELPGINDTIGYLDISNMKAIDLAENIKKKLITNDYFDKTKIKELFFDSLTINDGWNESTKYFHYEMQRAFPDIPGSALFNDKQEIHHRLSVLLRNPQAVGSGDSAHDPIWVFRGLRAFRVTRFKVIDADSCLLNNKELNIASIYVYYSGAYWKDYIYIVLAPQTPIGIEHFTEAEINKQIQSSGFADECFGIYKNKFIKYQEVENGYYVSNGKVHPIEGKAEIRYRYLSNYSFFIAPKASPLNHRSPEVQKYIDSFCLKNVNGEISIEEFNDYYNQIPRIDQKY